MLDLLAVGDVLLDVLGPPEAAGAVHGTIVVRPGGSAVNAARTASALGASAAVVGTVGNDAAGWAVAEELRRLGIQAHLSVDAARATGCAVYRGGRIVLADRGANAAFVPPATLPEARATLVSGHLPADAVQVALARAVGLRAVDLQGALEDGFGADVVLGPDLDLDRFSARHRIACATRGSGGAEAVEAGLRAQATPPRNHEESPVGAGDAFAAAFLLAHVDGLPLVACLERGCAAGASVEDA